MRDMTEEDLRLLMDRLDVIAGSHDDSIVVQQRMGIEIAKAIGLVEQSYPFEAEKQLPQPPG